jgi:hypothetical protein
VANPLADDLMDQAKEFDDKDSGAYPADRIFAVFDEHNRARKTVSLLNEEDFRPAEVGLLSGLADARKLDAASGETGLFAKLPIFGVDIGDRDSDYVKEYRQVLLDGKSVLAVVAKGEHMRDHVRHTLKSQGAHFIVLFGRFAVEVLES